MSQFFTKPLARRAAPLLVGLLAAVGTAQAQTLAFTGTGSPLNANNDVSVLLDKVEIVRESDGVVITSALANASFESPAQSSFTLNPAGGVWTFASRSGITANASPFLLPTPPPDGSQVAFLQSFQFLNGSISQALNALAVGTYRVRFAAVQRACCGPSNTPGTQDQSVVVSVGGAPLGTFYPASTTAFATFITRAFTVNGTGAVTLVANNALDFDGVNDFVQTTPTLAPQLGSGSLTMEAWVRTANTTGAALTAIGADGNNFNEYWLGMYLNKAVIFMAGGVSCASTTSINDGRWHHIAGIRSGANTTIYVDGQLENTTVIGAGVQASPTSYLAIGRYGSAPSGFGQYWQGSIEEARFYNTALTAAQVQADMNSTTSALPANQL